MIDDLFGGNVGSDVLKVVKKTSNVGISGVFGPKIRTRVPAREADADAWSLEPHICRACFSRIVSRAADAGPAGSRLYLCTNCGLEASGATPAVLCSCGMTVRRPTDKRRRSSQVVFVDAGVRCVPNPKIQADFSSLFVALDQS